VSLETICGLFSLSTMNPSDKSDRPVIGGQSVRPLVSPNISVGRWYPIKLVFQYRAYLGDRLVQTGAGETIEISSRALRLRMPKELPAQVAELDLAVAWPVALDGVTPLQWTMKAKPAWRAPGWIFVCIVSHEFRTAGARARQLMAACG
jgi:hypothetical protein